MASVTYPVLHLGRLAEMDTNEQLANAENYTALVSRTFGTSSVPLYTASTRLTLNDDNNDGQVGFDHNGSTETVRYTLGDITQSHRLDIGVLVQNVTVVQRVDDATTRTITAQVRLVQDTSGNVFMLPPRTTGTGTGEQQISELPIISIRFPALTTGTMSNYSSSFSGISASRTNLAGFRDGYVDGTDGDDLINAAYTGDIDRDRVDNGDAILPGAGPNDDFIRAGLGNDTVWAGAGADSVRGGDGNDVLYGYTSPTVDDGSNDSLDGGAGNDQIFGGGGDDLLIGGTGADTLDGGTGNDTIYGDDTLGTDSSGGADVINAGAGNDSVVAGFGNDTVTGGLGADTILGGAGDDRIFGDDTLGTDTQGGADSIDAGIGNDTVIAGAGNDTVIGGLGADTIQGNAGNDIIYGDDTAGTDTQGGADSIDAGTGNDSVIAGAGDDTVIGGQGADTIYGNAGNDTIYGDDINGTDSLGGADRLFGGEGDDLIVGGFGDDSLEGGAGNDTLQGGVGRDTLLGGEGDDLLEGGEGDDSLVGGGGADRLFGGAGNDRLEGGDGNDTLDGGQGSDTLTGGAGRDTFVARNGTTILDFNTGDIAAEQDSIDLSAYYNETTLAAWNAANPDRQFKTPLQWIRADQADDGRLNMLNGQNDLPTLNLALQFGNTAVAADALDGSNIAVLCFGADVLIETPEGPVPAGDLQVGTLVMTRDAGAQPIRWIGRRSLTAAQLEAAPNLRPIRIRAGALGRGTPGTDLIVSPQHRVLVRSKLAQRLFGAPEVLVAAKQLLLVEGIDVAEDLAGVDYVHFLFDDHQVVWSNGAETESLHPGRNALDMAGEAGREEIFAIFPELRDKTVMRASARLLASGRMGRKLAMRHVQNRKPLVS